MSNYQHLLTKHGILISFNIAKKIKQSQINSIRKRLEKNKTNSDKIDKLVDDEVKNLTQKYLDKNDIPGMITTDSNGEKIIIHPKIQRKILLLANKVAHFCKINNFKKDHVIFLIQAIFHLLKITNEDVNNFKEKYNISQDPDDDYLDEDDNDEEE